MRTPDWYRIATIVLPAFLVVAVLWKGGKSLESTWILIAVAWVCTMAFWWKAKGKETVLTPLRLWAPAMLLLLWTCLSFIFSSTLNYGLDEVLRDGALVFFVLWAYRTAGDHVAQRRLLLALGGAAVAAAAIGLAVYVLQPVNRFVGTFFDHRFHTDYWPNAWAEFALLAWPVLLLLARGDARHGKRWLWGLGFVLGALLLSYSRGAMLAFVLQLVIAGVLLRIEEGKAWKDLPWKRWARALTLPALVAGGIFLIGNEARESFHTVESVAAKIMFSAPEGTSSVGERGQFFRQAATMAMQRPLFGWGPYSFRFIQPRFQEGVLATSDHPHNALLKLAAERGIVAALAALAFALGAAWPALQRLRRRQGPREERERLSLLLLPLLGVGAHVMIDFNLQFVGIALPAALLLGMLAAAGGLLPGEPFLAARPARLVEVLLVSALCVVAVIEGQYLMSSSLGRHAEARGDAASALRWYAESEPERFSRDMHLSRTHLLIKEKRYEEAEAALDRYFKSNGEDARAWRLRTELLRVQKKPAEAHEAALQAFARGKWNDLATVRLLLETMPAKQAEAEKKTIQWQVNTLVSDYADAVERNAHFIALGGNVEEFLALVPLLSMIYPEDGPKYVVLGARVDRHAAEERARFRARPPGFLW